MKINIFVPTRSGGKFADNSLVHSSLTGEPVSGPVSPGDEIIAAIDESKMSQEKIVATRFLSFLETRRLTMESLKQLELKEQARIKQEFIES